MPRVGLLVQMGSAIAIGVMIVALLMACLVCPPPGQGLEARLESATE